LGYGWAIRVHAILKKWHCPKEGAGMFLIVSTRGMLAPRKDQKAMKRIHAPSFVVEEVDLI